jgi:hypothetical protein
VKRGRKVVPIEFKGEFYDRRTLAKQLGLSVAGLEYRYKKGIALDAKSTFRKPRLNIVGFTRLCDDCFKAARPMENLCGTCKYIREQKNKALREYNNAKK